MKISQYKNHKNILKNLTRTWQPMKWQQYVINCLVKCLKNNTESCVLSGREGEMQKKHEHEKLIHSFSFSSCFILVRVIDYKKFENKK